MKKAPSAAGRQQLRLHFSTALLTCAVVHSVMRSFASTRQFLRHFLRRLFIYPSALLLLTYALPVSAQADTQTDKQVGSPQDFAALTIRPRGPEELDLTTGVTTLPQGGEIGYRSEKVTLKGDYIRYLEGDFVEVKGALVTGEFGTLRAPELRFNVGAQTLEAQGGATFLGEALELTADTLSLSLKDDTALLEGNVTSQKPELTAQRVLVDLGGSQGLLVGPYTYQNGPIGLKGAAGKQLALSWDASGALSADSQVPAALQTRFASYLP